MEKAKGLAEIRMTFAVQKGGIENGEIYLWFIREVGGNFCHPPIFARAAAVTAACGGGGREAAVAVTNEGAARGRRDTIFVCKTLIQFHHH